MLSVVVTLEGDGVSRIDYQGRWETGDWISDGNAVTQKGAVVAVVIYFLELKLWMMANGGSVKGYEFRGPAKQSPINSLGSQINNKTWIDKCFPRDVDFLFPGIKFRTGNVPEGEDRAIGFKRDIEHQLAISVRIQQSSEITKTVEDRDELFQLRANLYKGAEWGEEPHPYRLPVEQVSPSPRLQAEKIAANISLSTLTVPIQRSEGSLFRLPGDRADHRCLPSYEDYLNGYGVAIRTQQTEVISNLQEHGCCYIEGDAGSGKKTLALSTALTRTVPCGPMLYVSLKYDQAICGRDWPAAMTEQFFRTYPGLLIVDDCHENVGTVDALMRGWKLTDKQSKVILLGQPTLQTCERWGAIQSRFSVCTVSLAQSETDQKSVTRAILYRHLRDQGIEYDAAKHHVEISPARIASDWKVLAKVLKSKIDKKSSWPFKLTAQDFKLGKTR